MPVLTAQEIATAVQGVLDGNAQTQIESASGLDEATHEAAHVVVDAQEVRVGDATGQHQPVVVVRIGLLDLLVDVELVAVVEVLEALDLAVLERQRGSSQILSAHRPSPSGLPDAAHPHRRRQAPRSRRPGDLQRALDLPVHPCRRRAHLPVGRRHDAAGARYRAQHRAA